MADIAFALNYTNLYLLDVTPEAAAPTWARVAAGITTVDPDDSDSTSDDAYYDGEGVERTDVTGVRAGYKFSGDRRFGDPAQDFVAAMRTKVGSGRVTTLKHIAPDGRVLEGEVTITDIVSGGGDANSKGTFEFAAHFNGLPTVTEPTKTTLPTKVEAEDVSVAVGASSTITPTVTPSTASEACAFGTSNPDVATVDGDGTVHGIAAGTCQVSVKSMVLPSVGTTVGVTVTA